MKKCILCEGLKSQAKQKKLKLSKSVVSEKGQVTKYEYQVAAHRSKMRIQEMESMKEVTSDNEHKLSSRWLNIAVVTAMSNMNGNSGTDRGKYGKSSRLN